jgi:hypothetical protein
MKSWLQSIGYGAIVTRGACAWRGIGSLPSILGGPFHLIDHQEFHRPLSGRSFQAGLALECGGERRGAGLNSRRGIPAASTFLAASQVEAEILREFQAKSNSRVNPVLSMTGCCKSKVDVIAKKSAIVVPSASNFIVPGVEGGVLKAPHMTASGWPGGGGVGGQ